MKFLFLICLCGVASLVILRLFEIRTNVPDLDRWVGLLVTSLGLVG